MDPVTPNIKLSDPRLPWKNKPIWCRQSWRLLTRMGFKCLITVPPWNSDQLAISGGKDHLVTLDLKCSFECHLWAKVPLDCFRQWCTQCRQMHTKRGGSSSLGRVRRNIFRQLEFNFEFRNSEYTKNIPV